MQVHFSAISGNIKTGPIPVTSSPRVSCPGSCPLKGAGGCYGEDFRLKSFWNKVDSGTAKNLHTWESLCYTIKALPKGQLWRHNQVGDLPSTNGNSENIDPALVKKLALANRGRRGFTYTHKSPLLPGNAEAIASANKLGFTINLSANSLPQADQYASLNIAPVVATVPIDHPKISFTPHGRKVIVCPAQQIDDLSCAKCGICAKADRSMIIAFRAHGLKKKALSLRLEVA